MGKQGVNDTDNLHLAHDKVHLVRGDDCIRGDSFTRSDSAIAHDSAS